MKRLMKRLLVVLVLLVVMPCLCAAANPAIPLPNDVLVREPNPNLSLEFNAFLGKWGGRWYLRNSSGGLEAILIVEEIIDERQAIVVYGCGNSPEWGVKEGWSRFAADFGRGKKGELTLSWVVRKGKFEFQVVKGDKLKGTLRNENYTTLITMERIQ